MKFVKYVSTQVLAVMLLLPVAGSAQAFSAKETFNSTRAAVSAFVTKNVAKLPTKQAIVDYAKAHPYITASAAVGAALVGYLGYKAVKALKANKKK